MGQKNPFTATFQLFSCEVSLTSELSAVELFMNAVFTADIWWVQTVVQHLVAIELISSSTGFILLQTKQTKQYANNNSREIVLVNTGASVSTQHIQSFSSIPEMNAQLI